MNRSPGIIVFAVLSIFTAAEVWWRSERALQLYGIWAIVYLTLRGMTQAISESAVALHLRYVLRQAV